MAGTNDIPELINSFNVYNEGNKLIGISGEVKLPDFDHMTETLSGPGILGEYAAPAIGHFSSMQISIPFRTVAPIGEIVNPDNETTLTLRGSLQKKTPGGKVNHVPMRVVTKGTVTKYTTGSVKQATALDVNIDMEILYIMIELEGQQIVELDKLNYVYKVNGRDLMEKVRANI